MFLTLLISLSAFLSAFGAEQVSTSSPTTSLAVQSFTDESERDLSLKKEVPLYIPHTLGNLSVQGWVQDRIRVKIKKKVLARTKEEAESEMKKFDLVTLETNQSFELRVGHARGSDLVTKLRDIKKLAQNVSEKQPSVSIDLEIKAPYQMNLTILLGDGRELALQQWKGAVRVTGKSDMLSFSRLNLQQDARINCQNCELNVSDSKIRGHFLVGNKNVLLKKVESVGSTFVDATTGEIRLEQTSGKIGLHSTTGRLSSLEHRGLLTLQSEDGGVFVNELRGNLEATTQSGQIMVDADSVEKFLHLDSDRSDIQVTLSPKFEGLLDLLSLRGEVVVQFPNEPNRDAISNVYGPVSAGRVDASVGSRHDITIHAYSKQGGVRILRKAPKR